MCTLEKRGRVYLITITGSDEHRLNPTLLGAYRAALDLVRDYFAASGGRGAALVTAAEGKFFSNGLDIAWARVSPSDRTPLMGSFLRDSMADLMSFPMPTIAAVTGHVVAGGYMLARSHDYIVMRGDRGFVYLSELDIGVPIARYCTALLRGKVRDALAVRDLVMQPEKMGAPEAARKGVIDRAVEGGAEAAVREAVKMGEEMAARGWDGRVYVSIRKSLFPEICKEVGLEEEHEDEIRKLFSSKM